MSMQKANISRAAIVVILVAIFGLSQSAARNRLEGTTEDKVSSKTVSVRKVIPSFFEVGLLTEPLALDSPEQIADAEALIEKVLFEPRNFDWGSPVEVVPKSRRRIQVSTVASKSDKMSMTPSLLAGTVFDEQTQPNLSNQLQCELDLSPRAPRDNPNGIQDNGISRLARSELSKRLESIVNDLKDAQMLEEAAALQKVQNQVAERVRREEWKEYWEGQEPYYSGFVRATR
jgi:hypothetical protein